MIKSAIIILSLLLNIIIPHIVIPFKGNNLTQILNDSKNIDLSEVFMKSTYYNQLYTSIGIGVPSQHVILNIIPKQKEFLFNKNNCLSFYNNKYIDKKSLTQNNKTIINISKIGYKRNLSKSFSKSNISNLFWTYNNKKYFSGKETLKIDDYQNILSNNYQNKVVSPYYQINLENFGFIYEEENIGDNGNNYEICGSIGLTFYYDKKNNKFIEQLKSSNITNNYYWSFNYSSLDKGYIIFGILPHQYNPFKYNENNLKEIYTNIDEVIMKWAMNLNEIYFFSNKNKKNELISLSTSISEGEFEFTLQLIIGSFLYKELIMTHFFKEYFDIHICKEEEYQLDIQYSIIKCKKNNFEQNIQDFLIYIFLTKN